MDTRLRLARRFLFSCLFVTLSCSSKGTTQDAAMDASAVMDGREAAGSDGPTSDSATAGDGTTEAPAGKPKTPEFVSAEPLSGSLHVIWRLNDAGLTGVEIWRKKDAGAYAKAYTMPGFATELHDSQARAPGTYCYYAVTVRDLDLSDMSNEKCGTP